MSIKDRLAKKTEGLLVPGKNETAGAAAAAPLRTSPGQMLMVNSLMKESNEKIAALEDRLKEFEGTAPVRLLNPETITASKWANRIEASFASAEYLQLKEEIAQAGGNVQPIKVRPLHGTTDRFEVVFGHRRHRVCLELGLQVLAFIEEVSDQDLFKEMDRENRARQDLSPWEQGRMYRRALDEKLFSSLGELAKELGVDKGNVSKALRLADLPEAVVDAFPSRLDLQYRWAKVLNDALQLDAENVLARARQINAQKDGSRSAKNVLNTLIGSPARVSAEEVIMINGKAVATLDLVDDRLSLRFAKGVMDEDKRQKLKEVLMQMLRE